MSELEAMIDMLEDDLEFMRKNPNDAYFHKITRVLLTLAQEIKALKGDS